MTRLFHGKRMHIAVLLFSFFILPVTAQASVVVTGTRVIYPESAREVTVKLNNGGSTPALIQSWIDNGDPKATPDVASSPFILTPPIARIDSHKGQVLRIRFDDDKTLPQDKESIYWLNILELPPSVEDGSNKLKIAVRTRLKMFYRPSGLQGDADKMAGDLEWTMVRSGNKTTLDCYNPGAYYVSLNSVKVGGKKVELNMTNGTVAPKQTQHFEMDNNATPGASINYSTINDYGAVMAWDSTLKN
ncbi:fimbrial biogenesis chaperone [Rahnella victoriana]|uniref:fimbrial biogenesis chaperone n=1 Tax=Rahnella victoriana TaxID=1510570 RepID=UPI001E2D83DE|nr:fimbria/pilus periplasmic chaperone [Rahnella victoriana]UHM93214.1 fimbria/pilus periplasmic chaperone [Rahnella victoriana]